MVVNYLGEGLLIRNLRYVHVGPTEDATADVMLPTCVQMQPHKSTTSPLEAMANTWMTLNCILTNCLYCCPSGQRLDKDREENDIQFLFGLKYHAKDFSSHLLLVVANNGTTPIPVNYICGWFSPR